MTHAIPVFYVPEMVGKPTGTYSPSAGKPAQVVADWTADFRIADAIEIVPFDSISRDTIALAHDPAYVSDVLARRADNGFGERSKSVADSLPFTSGSMLAAALYVLSDPDDSTARSRIACSPTSGFHHAHYSHGYGFCTFNGLMVTALELKRRDLIDRLLIVDCDEHYGDGTQDIIQHLGIDWVTHVTHGGKLPGSYLGKSAMVDLIEHHLPAFAGPRSVVLYQAGADCHVDDQLGLGGFLTTEDMRQRDRLVFSLAVKHRVPLVWNLAGGYQWDAKRTIAPVLTLHRNTVIEAIKAVRAGAPAGAAAVSAEKGEE